MNRAADGVISFLNVEQKLADEAVSKTSMFTHPQGDDAYFRSW